MTKKDAGEASKYAMESKLFGNKRSPAGRGDYGDDETVGLCLRRIGTNLCSHDFDKDDSFGRYLGQHPDGWVVGISKMDYSGWAGCEVFEDLDSLRRTWELD